MIYANSLVSYERMAQFEVRRHRGGDNPNCSPHSFSTSCQILMMPLSACCHVFAVYPSSWFQPSVPLLVLPWDPRGSHTEAGLGEQISGLPPRSPWSHMCLLGSRGHHRGLWGGIVISRFPSVVQMSVCSVYDQQLAEASHCSCFCLKISNFTLGKFIFSSDIRLFHVCDCSHFKTV